MIAAALSAAGILIGIAGAILFGVMALEFFSPLIVAVIDLAERTSKRFWSRWLP